MKYVLTTMMILFSFNAMATGSFHCTGKVNSAGGNVEVHVSGATSHIEGNPLLDKVLIHVDAQTDQHYEIPKERVVGYWSIDDLFLFNMLDSDFNNSEVKIMYNTDYKKGMMKLNLPGLKATTKKLICIFE